MAKKYYVQTCIPAGHEFDRSRYFDTYEEAAKEIGELHEFVKRLCEAVGKSYTILIYSEDVTETCPTCGEELVQEDGPNFITTEDWQAHLDVCDSCIFFYYQDEQAARSAAVREVRERWINKAPTSALTKRG